MPDTGASASNLYPQPKHLTPALLRHSGRSHFGQIAESSFMTIPAFQIQAQPCRRAKPMACSSFNDAAEDDFRNAFIGFAGS
jgi:hypothetical protein